MNNKNNYTAADFLESSINSLGSNEWRNFKGWTDYGAHNPNYLPKTVEAMDAYTKQEKLKLLTELQAEFSKISNVDNGMVNIGYVQHQVSIKIKQHE